jgi:hypothetical protein
MMVASLREEAFGERYDLLKHAEGGCGVWGRYVEGNLGRMVGVGMGDEENDVEHFNGL